MALLAAGLMATMHPDGWPLIWSDEFDGEVLDPSKWEVVEDCWGGGNDERQCYAMGNVRLDGSHLVLTAHREVAPTFAVEAIAPTQVSAYSSGKVRTRGRASFRYGRIEVRAWLPRGQGLWPAVWMLPEHDNYGPYPQSGEIDIAEAVNLGVSCAICSDRIYGARHHGPSLDANRQEGGFALIGDADTFHVFALEWTPDRMVWLLDGRPYFEADSGPPWDQRFHLILNLAVGGRWPEQSGTGGVDNTVFPAELRIDYVRVYAMPSVE